ncbi:ATP-binding protein [Macrococcus capreoli]|uniref:ATP-binding protein n=1 Tax=Macrococcus capreoli TaxID=2982690 RepID=UPI0021D59A23|nr:ATP-binding protein [Macrococcus sp. TMW 2.2395]MCU7556599.1 ATP-binding protein [Macrococcus sp. TMW 2.2395]
MKVINYGSTYEIYENELKTFDALPAQTYLVKFHPMAGFSLKQVTDFVQKEEKLYGTHEVKIEKVLSAFEKQNRSLGVILSGDKGIGKSLFTQLLAEKVIEKGLPVILVTDNYPNVAEFIEKITQECLVLFDEFEKVFPYKYNDEGSTQDSMLGLFDGTSQQKRLYAITVNDLHKVSPFLINRPGRFHYHIRFAYPTPSEIREYLTDKVSEEYHSEIKAVELFSSNVKLNFDCLRAIAFELDNGTSFTEAIQDLNILSTEAQRYNVLVTFQTAEGKEIETPISNEQLDLFSANERLEYYSDSDCFTIAIDGTAAVESDGGLFISGGDCEVLYLSDGNDRIKPGSTIKNVVLMQQAQPMLHYVI